jgi:hypothetical protein
MKEKGVEPKLISNDHLGHYGTNMTFILNPTILTRKKTRMRLPEMRLPKIALPKLYLPGINASKNKKTETPKENK